MDLSLDGILAFIEANRAWAGLVFGLMAFGESMAVVGILIPATSVMMACGALVGAGTLSIFDLWIGGAIGASVGDTVSYALGRYLGPRANHIWPLRKYPHLVASGHHLFSRWGWAAVFVGRFIGPLRAIVPLVAGIMEMPSLRFQIANVTSAILWIPVLVAPGALIGRVVELVHDGHSWLAALLGVAGFAGLGIAFWLVRRHGGRLLPPKDGDRPPHS